MTNKGEYRPILALKIGCHATSLQRSKKGQILNLRSNTYRMVKMVKIGPVDPEVILSERFILNKEMTGCTSLPFLNYAVTGLKFTKFTRNVARSSQMIFLKSEWRYCNPFQNAGATSKGGYSEFCQF